MVDLRGKPPYLPPDMTYTDVLKHAIEKGLKFFGKVNFRLNVLP